MDGADGSRAESDQLTGSPHPGAPEFAKAYSEAWTSDLPKLLTFFAADGSDTDVAMGTTFEGHDGISRFHRFMLKFAPDSLIEFGDGHVADSRLYLEWVWSGTFAGPLRLRSGKLIDASGVRFSVPGFAACEYGEDGLLTVTGTSGISPPSSTRPRSRSADRSGRAQRASAAESRAGAE